MILAYFSVCYITKVQHADRFDSWMSEVAVETMLIGTSAEQLKEVIYKRCGGAENVREFQCTHIMDLK